MRLLRLLIVGKSLLILSFPDLLSIAETKRLGTASLGACDGSSKHGRRQHFKVKNLVKSKKLLLYGLSERNL